VLETEGESPNVLNPGRSLTALKIQAVALAAIISL
jgi:hypothetical protein